MTNKREITPAQMRKELKAMGYKVRTKSYSEFSAASVFLGDEKINGGNVMSEDFHAKHKAFFDWKTGVSIIENGWRTIV